MELWFIYALSALFFTGIGYIIQKVVAERKIDPAYLLVTQGITYIIFVGVIFLVSGNIASFFQWKIILVAFSVSMLYSFSFRTRIVSLRYLDASEFFIGYRILQTILAICVGVLLFQEYISGGQYLGIMIGFMAIAFLYEPRERIRAQKELLRGILFLIFSALFTITFHIISKDFSLSSSSTTTFLLYFFWQGFTYIGLTCITDWKKIHDIEAMVQAVRKEGLIFLISAIMITFAALATMLAYQAGGSLSVVLKIVSYSLFIPIIYSAIVYHEKLTWKKWIAMILTVISIWFLF